MKIQTIKKKNNFILFDFPRTKYKVVKKIINKDMADFIYNYFFTKRKVTRLLFDHNMISPSSTEWGTWKHDQMINTYSHYADIVMETLLEKIKPKIEKQVQFKLTPTYSYARIYKKGDMLPRHKDRSNCEVSGTLFLGGDKWDIYLDPSGKSGKKGKKVKLDQGDILLYAGCEVEHWREPFKGENCCQVFLHYGKTGSAQTEQNKFDRRPFLGLPDMFKE